MGEDSAAALEGAIRVDEKQLRGHIDEAVRSSVEETLNALLDAEAEGICRAQRYERSSERVDTRAGHYERKLAGYPVIDGPRRTGVSVIPRPSFTPSIEC